MTTRIHMSLSVDIDRFTDAQLRREWLPFFEGTRVTTVEGIRKACADMRAKGYDVFPNPECDNRTKSGGCAGHEVDDDT